MATTDKISFGRLSDTGDEVIEWGQYGLRWPLKVSWTNIGGHILTYKENNKYFTYIQNGNSPYCVIKRKGLYYLSLHNVIMREGSSVDATQVGHCAIDINDEHVSGGDNVNKMPFLCSKYFYWPRSDVYCMILQCSGMMTLNVGDTVAAYVSKSNINNYNLYVDGKEFMTIVHLCDRL